MKPAVPPLPDPDRDRRIELAADGFVSVTDAAEFLGLGRTEVYRLMGGGLIEWAQYRGKRLVSRRSLIEFGATLLVTGNVTGADRG